MTIRRYISTYSVHNVLFTTFILGNIRLKRVQYYTQCDASLRTDAILDLIKWGVGVVPQYVDNDLLTGLLPGDDEMTHHFNKTCQAAQAMCQG